MNLQTPAISTFQKTAARALGSRRPRRGFTLIELLVVIGIILILMGLFFVGAKIVTAQAKERDTRTMLETCSTLFANYRSATNLSRPPPAGTGTMAITTSNLSAFGPANSITTSRFWTVGQVAAPGTLPTDASAYSTPLSVSQMPQALIDTAFVMYALKSIPENATILNNIPAGKTLNVSIALRPTGRGVSNIFSVPVLLDGWGNPILFVPGGGLTNIWVDGTNIQKIMTSAGVITANSNPVALAKYDPANTAFFPAGSINAGQPFFVSAGPDGDFSNAQSLTDDNIYSFK